MLLRYTVYIPARRPSPSDTYVHAKFPAFPSLFRCRIRTPVRTPVRMLIPKRDKQANLAAIISIPFPIRCNPRMQYLFYLMQISSAYVYLMLNSACNCRTYANAAGNSRVPHYVKSPRIAAQQEIFSRIMLKQPHRCFRLRYAAIEVAECKPIRAPPGNRLRPSPLPAPDL